VLLSNSKYCSWEPGHSRHAGALAVVIVAKPLRKSDANSMERKEGDLGGRRGVPRSFGMVIDVHAQHNISEQGTPRFGIRSSIRATT